MHSFRLQARLELQRDNGLALEKVIVEHPNENERLRPQSKGIINTELQLLAVRVSARKLVIETHEVGRPLGTHLDITHLDGLTGGVRDGTNVVTNLPRRRPRRNSRRDVGESLLGLGLTSESGVRVGGSLRGLHAGGLGVRSRRRRLLGLHDRDDGRRDRGEGRYCGDLV
ncbi:hypothetical protein ITJ57_16335 [Plantibacter sp. VKM Ac-2880]|uniref:hypothetical protein n=1 Tax=Plantibacter sp. VKM Ac-2880 TaxID=2783827 RepID=UPI00188E7EE6|nr:hypothetical protein [Plantibacter sp. VKM Ac-2880]MBF4570338.1 hypothetical protein [Plantibacter sp. VKM Ac-2880]